MNIITDPEMKSALEVSTNLWSYALIKTGLYRNLCRG
jgi:hypothetical protein